MTIKSNAKLEEEIRDAEKANEPGEISINPIVHRGDDKAPTMVATVESAGYTWVYDTTTGVPSKVNNNMLPSMLRKKRADDSYVFGTRQLVIPKQGTFKCYLHASDPNRGHYDDLGFAVCPKDNLSAPFHVRRHMQKRHKVEWAAIEEERKDKEKAEDREFQRMLIGKATEKAPLYVSNKDKK